MLQILILFPVKARGYANILSAIRAFDIMPQAVAVDPAGLFAQFCFIIETPDICGKDHVVNGKAYSSSASPAPYNMFLPRLFKYPCHFPRAL